MIQTYGQTCRHTDNERDTQAWAHDNIKKNRDKSQRFVSNTIKEPVSVD